MKYDIVLAGVGGQGVLSLGAIIANGARRSGFVVKQSEVHGMSQRGGAVQANLRISDLEIASDLVPRNSASMILSMEPVESLRYLDYLAPNGQLTTSMNPVENVPNYPELETVYEQIRRVPGALIVDSLGLARQAGSLLAMNMVMVGAASTSLPIEVEVMKDTIRDIFDRKGDRIVNINLDAFDFGRAVG